MNTNTNRKNTRYLYKTVIRTEDRTILTISCLKYIYNVVQLHKKKFVSQKNITFKTINIWVRGLDRMVGGFTTTCAVNAYHH